MWQTSKFHCNSIQFARRSLATLNIQERQPAQEQGRSASIIMANTAARSKIRDRKWISVDRSNVLTFNDFRTIPNAWPKRTGCAAQSCHRELSARASRTHSRAKCCDDVNLSHSIANHSRELINNIMYALSVH